MRLLAKFKFILGVSALLLACRVHAFPPAPDSVIYGMVRDELGNPLTLTNATIILETTTGVALATKVVPYLDEGINYRLQVPMDSGLTADPYKATALRPTVSFRIKVCVGQATNLPIQMQGDYSQLGQPAQRTRIDLTLGQDSVGDGLPDAWRRMILAMSGGLFTNLNQILADGRFPGNPYTFRECYNAGLYPWDPNDGFALAVVDKVQGVPVMQFNCIQGHSYAIQGSSDLMNWNAVSFRHASDSHDSTLMNSYTSTNNRTIRVEVPPQNGTTCLFFRGVVQ